MATGAVIIIAVGTAVMWLEIGWLLGHALRRRKKETSGGLRALNAGLLLAAAGFGLLPGALSAARWQTALAGFLSGILLLCAARLYWMQRNAAGMQQPADLKSGMQQTIVQELPAGIALGAGFALSRGFGIKFLIIFAVYALLSGIEKVGQKQTIRSAAGLAGGCLIGAVTGNLSVEFAGVCLAVAAGAVFVPAFAALLPQAGEQERANAGSTIAGMILGLVITLC